MEGLEQDDFDDCVDDVDVGIFIWTDGTTNRIYRLSSILFGETSLMILLSLPLYLSQRLSG